MNSNLEELYKKKYLKYKAKYLNLQRGGVYNNGINHPAYKIGKVLITKKSFRFLRKIGNTQDINKLSSPELMAFDNSGNIVLADTGNKIVKIINPLNGLTIRTIGAIYTGEYKPGHLYNPIGVAFANADHIIVSDRMSPDMGQLVVFNYSDGLHVRTFAIRPYNSDETGQSLCNAGSIAVSNDGNVFALDGYDSLIKIFNISTGNFMRSICSKGDKPGQIGGDGNIVFNNNGNIVVADSVNKRIQIINSSGQVLKLFNTKGIPSSIIVDSDNNIIVTVTNTITDTVTNTVTKRNCVMVYNMNGNILKENCFVYGYNNGEVLTPSGIAVNTEGNIFVIDNGLDRIQIFE